MGPLLSVILDLPSWAEFELTIDVLKQSKTPLDQAAIVIGFSLVILN
jgi:hypothetical protein